MKPYPWLLAIACASCGVTPTPYEVIAAADLRPGTLNIHGPLELLGAGNANPVPYDSHVVAAYRVQLPDQKPRRIRLFTPASCDTPHDDVTMVYNLGEIRRVGDETHFFARNVLIGDRTVDIDVETVFAFLHLEPQTPFYALDMIAVVQDAIVDEGGPAPGNGQPGSGPDDWLACGVFTLPK